MAVNASKWLASESDDVANVCCLLLVRTDFIIGSHPPGVAQRARGIAQAAVTMMPHGRGPGAGRDDPSIIAAVARRRDK